MSSKTTTSAPKSKEKTNDNVAPPKDKSSAPTATGGGKPGGGKKEASKSMDYAGLLEEVKKRLFEMGFGDMWFDEDIVECLKQNNHDLPKTVEFIISAPKPADFQVQGKKAKKQLAKEQQKKENEKKQKEQTNKKRDQKIQQQQSQYDEPKTQPETNRPPRRNPPRPNPKYSNPNYQNHTTQYEDYDYEEEDDQYSSYPRPPPPTLLPAPQPEKAKPAPPPTSAITTPAVSYSDKVLGHAAPQPAPTPALAPVPAPSAPVAKKSAPAPQYRPAARQPQTPVYKPKAIAPEAPPKDTPPVPPPQAPTDPLPAKQPQRPPKEAPAEVSDPPTSKEPNEKPTQPEDNSEKQRRNQNTNTRGRGRGRGGYRGGRGANNNKTKAQWQEKKISPPPKIEETQNQQGEDTVEVVSSTTKGKTRGVKLPDNLTNELEDLDIEFGNEDSALPDGSEIVIVKQETLVDASPQGDGFSENGVEASSNPEKATEQHPPESVPRPAQAAGLRPPEPSQASQQPAPSQSAHPHHSNPDIPNSVPPMVQFQNMMPFGVLSPHSGHVQQHMAHVSPHSIPMMPPPYPAFEAMEHGGMGFYDGQYPIHGPSYSQMSVENGHETGASMNINEDNQSSFNPGHEEEEDHSQQGPGVVGLGVNPMMGMLPPIPHHQSGSHSFPQSGFSFPYSLSPNPYQHYPQLYRYYYPPKYQNQNQFAPSGQMQQFDEDFQKGTNMGMNMPGPYTVHQGMPVNPMDHSSMRMQNQRRQPFPPMKGMPPNAPKGRKDDMAGQTILKTDSNQGNPSQPQEQAQMQQRKMRSPEEYHNVDYAYMTQYPQMYHPPPFYPFQPPLVQQRQLPVGPRDQDTPIQ